VARTLEERLGPYRAAFPAVRWLGPESLHVTLLFLGDVDPRGVPEIVAIVEEAAASQGPFEAETGAGSGRARGGDGVAWLTLPRGGDQIVAMSRRLEAATPSRILQGGRDPRRSPSAHLTVARRADQPVIDALAAQQHGPLAAAWTADRIVLFRSHLGSRGAAYEALHTAMLRA
jgi:2'-5' RNA ligase